MNEEGFNEGEGRQQIRRILMNEKDCNEWDFATVESMIRITQDAV